tara:strand:- start:6316 stop:6486 length:171 start_codon:yes stop_codon:yes gene_type:complete
MDDLSILYILKCVREKYDSLPPKHFDAYLHGEINTYENKLDNFIENTTPEELKGKQ